MPKTTFLLPLSINTLPSKPSFCVICSQFFIHKPKILCVGCANIRKSASDAFCPRLKLHYLVSTNTWKFALQTFIHAPMHRKRDISL